MHPDTTAHSTHIQHSLFGPALSLYQAKDGNSPEDKNVNISLSGNVMDDTALRNHHKEFSWVVSAGGLCSMDQSLSIQLMKQDTSNPFAILLYSILQYSITTTTITTTRIKKKYQGCIHWSIGFQAYGVDGFRQFSEIQITPNQSIYWN